MIVGPSLRPPRCAHLFRLRWSRTEGSQVYKRRSNDDQTTNEVGERRQNENLKGGRDFQRVKVGKSGLTEADPLLSQNRSMSYHFITWRLYGVELSCTTLVHVSAEDEDELAQVRYL